MVSFMKELFVIMLSVNSQMLLEKNKHDFCFLSLLLTLEVKRDYNCVFFPKWGK